MLIQLTGRHKLCKEGINCKWVRRHSSRSSKWPLPSHSWRKERSPIATCWNGAHKSSRMMREEWKSRIFNLTRHNRFRRDVSRFSRVKANVLLKEKSIWILFVADGTLMQQSHWRFYSVNSH